MKKTTRILALLLSLLMAVAVFAGCDDDTVSTPDNSTAGTTSETTDDGFKLPDRNWGDRTVVVCAVGGEGTFNAIEFGASEQVNEPVNDAVYERNMFINEKYGITITQSNKTNYVEVVESITNNISGGRDDYQLAATSVLYMATLLAEPGHLYDLNTANAEANVDYLNLSADWWDQTAVRDLSIANSLFLVTGDIAVTDNASTWAIFFNKTIAEENDLGNLYQTVRDNQWTIDYLKQASRQATKLVGNSMDFTADTDDTWGMVTQTYDGVSFMWGCGQSMIGKDENDEPVLRMLDERNVTVFNLVLDLLLDSANIAVADHYGRWDSGIYGVQSAIFTNGHALFFSNNLRMVDTDQMRNADIKYGILPMPKADEHQEEYSSSGNVYACTVVGIPISVSEELDLTLFAMEAMAYYGKTMVTDAYYEITLKGKRTDDDESAEMLDILFKNRTYDLSAIYDWGGALYIYTGQIGDRQNTLASAVQSKQSAIETDMKTTVDTIKAMK